MVYFLYIIYYNSINPSYTDTTRPDINKQVCTIFENSNQIEEIYDLWNTEYLDVLYKSIINNTLKRYITGTYINLLCDSYKSCKTVCKLLTPNNITPYILYI